MSCDPGLHVVRDNGSESVNELREALVPQGEYEVFFAEEKRISWFNRQVWLCVFRISEGEYAGVVLPMWLNIPPGRQPIRRGHAMAQAYVVSTGRRPPRDLGRSRPSWFLGDCAFLAYVRTVRRDMNGVERPEEASYSRVNHLIKRTAGTPPCLRARKTRT
jgi:hypothetical protein